MILPRLGLRVLLALALVLAQQAAALHRQAHATEQTHGVAHEPACEGCLAVAALDKPIVAPMPGATVRGEVVVEAPAMHFVALVAAGGRAAYRSRAPPLPSA